MMSVLKAAEKLLQNREHQVRKLLERDLKGIQMLVPDILKGVGFARNRRPVPVHTKTRGRPLLLKHFLDVAKGEG